MTKLRWDQIGTRFYETGIDRGVLYLEDGTVVPWNGITGVEEDLGNDGSTPYYIDGVKYLDSQNTGDYVSTLRAFTYPPEFEEYQGSLSLLEGFMASGQPMKSFGLSYRTLIGNDINGTNLGYKIHLLYNLVAVQDIPAYQSLNDQPQALEFSWRLMAVPEMVEGYRPTAHVIIDSRYINKYLLRDLENILYGSDTIDPSLTSLDDLVKYIQDWDIVEVVDNGDGTWTATGPSELVFYLDDTTFQINGIPVTWLASDTYKIETTIEEDGG